MHNWAIILFAVLVAPIVCKANDRFIGNFQRAMESSLSWGYLLAGNFDELDKAYCYDRAGYKVLFEIVDSE